MLKGVLVVRDSDSVRVGGYSVTPASAGKEKQKMKGQTLPIPTKVGVTEICNTGKPTVTPTLAGKTNRVGST